MNECPKCKQFDEETKTKMRELFGRDEIIMIGTTLASLLVTFSQGAAKMQKNDLRKFKLKAQADAASMTMGKFVVSLEPEDQQNFFEAIKKQSGVILAVNHEKCPHQNEEGTPNE